MAERVKVPLNEPGLVRVGRDKDGMLSSEDRARLRAVYRVLGKEPARLYRLRTSRSKNAKIRRAKHAGIKVGR